MPDSSTGPYFIVLEGADGAGKSTQIALLKDKLGSLGIDCTVTREPGGSESAEIIRDLLLSGTVRDIDATGEALLFAAARHDHVNKIIRPALEKDQWVLCDRFFHSTRVYQGVESGARKDVLESLEEIAVGSTRPDLVLILDVPLDVSIKRMQDRLDAKLDSSTFDRFEGEGRTALEKRRAAFLDLPDQDESCVVIDADGAADRVSKRIWSVVNERLLNG